MKENDRVCGRSSLLVQNMRVAVFVGLAMIFIALTVSQSGMNEIWLVANLFSGVGNDVFLVIGNGILFWSAYKERCKSLFYAVIKIDAAVWTLVHALKYVDLGEWSLRPNGIPSGFPSGHATHAFAMAFLLTVFYPRLAWLWYGSAVAISWSRIEISAHTGVQVTAGVILGIGVAWLGIKSWVKRHDLFMMLERTTP
ncbi:phosphatase PAP2 family protein [Sporomusa acidovorans]|uniref:Phosphatidic acid phosphatase type 2/haloperoxidase domain-containing protein n=1 Tax=Sporomusa acidovorans (strain ATCC 49682 / DSM 3132 / Mol) TaxID=1123286 RepID=A0ABZ3IZ77_SPOA4|nr:phosphatase PAP2 family protein [Sporomusa acidovorans]OZC19158.1 PAP2 superfamily protein [Sporomusa acidovorans DSM 3132]SDF12101.1 PAP2 superfamily protein [Sporomusa acidovorans]